MISVIVCTYNRCESLRDTLNALKGQAMDHEVAFEVIVVDNNSTDGTKAVVTEAARESRWPIRYVFESAQGLSHARNRGIQEAQGEIVAFTDDDVVPDARWVEALAQAFLSESADCVGGRVKPLWGVPPPKWLEEAIQAKRFLAVFSLFDRGDTVIVADTPDPTVAYGANMAFRKSVFDTLGLFRIDLGVTGTVHRLGEDTDMVERCFLAGKRTVYTPHAIVYHKIPTARMQKRYLRNWKYLQGQSSAPERFDWRLIKDCARDAARALAAYARGAGDLGLVYEAASWVSLGRLLEVSRRRTARQG